MKRPALLTQVLAVNALLIAAAVLGASAAAHLDISAVADRRRLLVLVAAILGTILVNGVVLRRRFSPLERVIEAMEGVEFGGGTAVAELPAPDTQEVARLNSAFSSMVRRLEQERERTAGAVLHAQESERARMARDLHDEANQALTGVLLRLEATAQHAPEELREELRATQEAASQAMEELLRLARELRPASLDDLGLAAALRTKVDEVARRTGLLVELRLDALAFERLTREEQLVVYRVVQESLSNVAQHARARRVRVEVSCDAGGTLTRVIDDGIGFGRPGGGGLGLSGMRERAALAGGRLEIHSRPGVGTTVELRLGRPA
jgi:two-component system, NarL family, sensor histidine kinase UhpB